MVLDIALFVAYLILAFLSNADLVVTRYRLPSPSRAARGLRIAHLSDLHGRSFGRGGRRLLARLKALAPDFVVLTGDLVSQYQRSWRKVVASAAALASRYPVYYIPGNHERLRPDMADIAAALGNVGVTVLQDRLTTWTGRGGPVAIIGMADYLSKRDRRRYGPTLKSLVASANGAPVKILLSHRPQLTRLYSESGSDFVFSGHAHGGQINVPGRGPLYSPDEGLWPRYAAGVHRLDGGTTLVVSRGLGGPWFVPRIANRPEIVLVELD